ncbi:ribonuclease H-like domain-containing protein [Tanacetum coccineum]
MYSFDMKNIVPKERLTCLVANATLDESMLWHRRLGHINFKNINKLVKDNLVRGLPIKHFENDQTCVACLKGKQHRASCLRTNCTVSDDFCREKGIKREYSVARTPQQNGVAKRRNRTLIKAARTMLADFKLPTTFWAEAVSRKFDGKSDEGFFVGYSLSSKAFRVYNTRTRSVEENLHIAFLENKPMIEGTGPKWLFDIDSLTQSMNYVPVSAGTVSNVSAVVLKLNVVGPSVNTASPNEQDSTEEEPEVDLGNITNSYIVPTTPNTRIHKDHLIDNVIVWILVDLPNGKKATGTKWVFRNKKDKRGIVIRIQSNGYVAQGHSQEQDVKSVFLYGTIKEEVYVTQPPGFKDPDHPYKVYKVVKTLYGLHQAPRACLLQLLCSIWKKPFGQGLEMLDDVFRMYLLYRSMIGSLMYLTTSRPDIMFAVCACARFQVTPKTSHLLAVKRIFRYLKGKPTLGLWYSRDSPFELVAYTDSDYAGAIQDRKSTTGGCQFLGNRLISWQCKKQTVVATSTTEAEYVAAASCCGQIFLQKVLMQADFKSLRPVVPQKKVGDEAVHKELGDRMERAVHYCLTRLRGIDAGPMVSGTGAMIPYCGRFSTAGILSAAKLMLASVNAIRHILMLLVQVPTTKGVSINTSIKDLNKDNDVTLVDETQERQDDELMFDTGVLDTNEMPVEAKVDEKDKHSTKLDDSTTGEAIKAVKPKVVTTASTTTTTTRPKAKGVVVQEPSEFRVLQEAQPSISKDKEKGIMIEPEVPLKRKDQIALDEKIARDIQAKLDAELIEEQKLARKQEEEANIALIESWENTQAMMKADRLLAERLQSKEREELTDEEKGKLFMELMEKRRKHLVAPRAQEKRNGPPTKAQKRTQMSTYLKHMGGYTYKQLKGKSFDEIQKLFDKEMKRVNTFVAIGSEVHESKEKKVEGSEETAKCSRKKMLGRKRAGKEQCRFHDHSYESLTIKCRIKMHKIKNFIDD